MNSLIYFTVYTANILGIFNDPFEFEGDYGPDINPIRQQVFQAVVSKEALAKNKTDDQIIQLYNEVNADNVSNLRYILINEAIKEDRQHGPSFSELVTPNLITAIKKKQQELQNSDFDNVQLTAILDFIERFADQKVFYFFRHSPHFLLSLDKTLRDKASREGKVFDLPILSSTQPLDGNSSEELKEKLLETIITSDVINLAKPELLLKPQLEDLDADYLASIFGKDASNNDLAVFCTPAGQAVFYWLYQSLNLHLISENPDFIEQINLVKTTFASTLADPYTRAQQLKERLMTTEAGVLFTQESDSIVAETLIHDGSFLPLQSQNQKDGTLIFLRSGLWEKVNVISIDNYEGYSEGRINAVIATNMLTDQQFFLASAHGSSTDPRDGRLQIKCIVDKFHELKKSQGNENLQLLIGIDANTKSESDVEALRLHLDNLGLTATSVGPTTIKCRMVTAQHSKAGRFAIDEEDYIITLKPDKGGAFSLNNQTVGFSSERPNPSITLPNTRNPSDHYPVGATIIYE